MMVKKLNRDELKESLPLIWSVFTEFEACNYPEDGKQAFWNAIHDKNYLDSLTAYGAFDQDALIGITASRNHGEHIALFFVDGKYHRKGIGRMLWELLLSENDSTSITVHSSLFAENVYKKLGFIPTDTVQEENGIRFIPMMYQRKQPNFTHIIQRLKN